jgi:transcriptional regulator with XRE-family HTH domain
LLPGVSETFQEQLQRLRRERGISRGVLSRRTVQPGDMGISEQTIEALERKPRQKPLDRTIRLLGEALEATDEEFPAFALAKGRALLDEHVVGLDAALANLAKVRQALGLEPQAPPAPGEDEETLRLAAGEEIELPGEQDADTG